MELTSNCNTFWCHIQSRIFCPQITFSLLLKHDYATLPLQCAKLHLLSSMERYDRWHLRKLQKSNNKPSNVQRSHSAMTIELGNI